MPEGLWIVGDVQGYLNTLETVLVAAGLIDSASRWTGGGAALAVAGDLVDRGPDGIGVIDLLMRLQSESGGRVHVVVGNHDVQLLAAHRFGGPMVTEWLDAGGIGADLERLGDAHVEWLTRLPAMFVVNDSLVLHADALFYREYGSSVESVNATFRQVLDSGDLSQWRLLLDRFGEHRAFFGTDGESQLTRFLTTFGGTTLVHGHTPIARMLGVPPESVQAAYTYRGGRCVNVDPGIYLGGPGFAHHLS